jgi:hypothetical protein
MDVRCALPGRGAMAAAWVVFPNVRTQIWLQCESKMAVQACQLAPMRSCGLWQRAHILAA